MQHIAARPMREYYVGCLAVGLSWPNKCLGVAAAIVFGSSYKAAVGRCFLAERQDICISFKIGFVCIDSLDFFHNLAHAV